MKLRYEEGLIFVDIEIEYNGKTMEIKDIVLDTGASRTIIDTDLASRVGINASTALKITTMYGIGGVQYAFRHKIDKIKIDGNELQDISIDVGMVDEEGEINGLLGLDVLLKLGAVVDLDNLTLSFRK